MAKNKFIFDDTFKLTQEEVIRNLNINPVLKALIPPLTNNEKQQLESNILAEGCRDALIVWKYKEDFVLIDGHNRYEICTKHNIPFKTELKEFSDIEEVKDWMINNQLGKRNVTEEIKSYLRGLQYKMEKQKQGGTGANQHNSRVESLTTLQKTSEKLSEQHKVSEKTIRNDEKFVNNLNAFVGDDADLRWKILNKELSVSKTDLEKIVNQSDSEIKKLKQELKEKGKINLPKEKSESEEKKLKLNALFSQFLKTPNEQLSEEIYKIMKTMV